MESVVDIYLYLIIYSFLGWLCESIYCSVLDRRIQNRGFLNGPFCPVYGFGALITLKGLQFFNKNKIIVFIGGMILTSVLEYITSYLMEKLFHAKWWDYSGRKFNINGRVCLLNSTLFGLMCVCLEFYVHPVVVDFLSVFSLEFKLGFMSAFFIYFVIDFSVTVWSVLGLNTRLATLQEIKSQLIIKYDNFNNESKYSKISEFIKLNNLNEELIHKFNEKIRIGNIFQKRIIKAFPNIKSKKYNDIMKELKAVIRERKLK